MLRTRPDDGLEWQMHAGFSARNAPARRPQDMHLVRIRGDNPTILPIMSETRHAIAHAR